MSFYTQLQTFINQARPTPMSHKTKGIYSNTYNGLTVDVSFGNGRHAKVPYITFLGPGQETKRGIYPAYLYYKKHDLLILAYGISEGNVPTDNWILPSNPRTIKDYFKHKGLGVPDSYGKSYVFKAYDLKKITIGPSFDTHLDSLIRKYKKVLKSKPSATSGGSSSASSGSTSSATLPPLGPTKYEHAEHKNVILYGPPGTGKTYNSIRYAVSIIKGYKVADIKDNNQKIDGKTIKESFKELMGEGQIRFTTFHQSLSYEDFIEGIKPVYYEADEVLKYPVLPGIFKQICEEAKKHSDKNFVLIIDEINRGNVAQIFGELITLIEDDKREGAENELFVILPYSAAAKAASESEEASDPVSESVSDAAQDSGGDDGSSAISEKFKVPKNLYILGTMNTADRSVEALDSALRRRFTFIEMMPDASLVPDRIKGAKISPQKVLETMNRRIEVLKDSEHQIGHSYLMNVTDVSKMMEVFRYKLIPLLQEYFFGDRDRIKMVIGEGFFTEPESTESLFSQKAKNYNVDYPNRISRLWGDKEWTACENDSAHTAFINAIVTLMD